MCDHITGEEVGGSFEKLYRAGAKNVQVMNTITKKNRPGYLFVIDCDKTSADAIEDVLVTEIGTTGWHRVDSSHCYTDVEYLKKKVTFYYEKEGLTEEVSCKYSPDVPKPYRIERDCLDYIERKIWDSFKITVSSQRLYQMLVHAFQDPKTEYIDLKGETHDKRGSNLSC